MRRGTVTIVLVTQSPGKTSSQVSIQTPVYIVNNRHYTTRRTIKKYIFQFLLLFTVIISTFSSLNVNLYCLSVFLCFSLGNDQLKDLTFYSPEIYNCKFIWSLSVFMVEGKELIFCVEARKSSQFIFIILYYERSSPAPAPAPLPITYLPSALHLQMIHWWSEQSDTLPALQHSISLSQISFCLTASQHFGQIQTNLQGSREVGLTG